MNKNCPVLLFAVLLGCGPFCEAGVSSGRAVAFPACASASAGQDDLLFILQKAGENLVEAVFTYTVDGSGETGQGKAYFQENAYALNTGVLGVVSDGESFWTVDPVAREAVAESGAPSLVEILSRTQLTLRRDASGVVRGAHFVYGEVSVDLVFTAVRYLEKTDRAAFFTFQAPGKDWVVTDLR